MASPLIALILFLVGAAVLWTIINFFTRDMQLPLTTCIWWLLLSRLGGLMVGMLLLAIIGKEEAVVIVWVIEEIITILILFYFLRTNYSEIAWKILGTFFVIMLIARFVLSL